METTRTVTMIPARRRVGNTVREEERPKLRVAAYCRVSTDSDEQATSYETQVEHYTSYIKKNPEWEFAGIFLMTVSVVPTPRNEKALIK